MLESFVNDTRGAMNLLQNIIELPRSEKIKIMESIWEDLTKDEGEFESPTWHAVALRETEKRLEQGKEQMIDWAEAKKELRKVSE